MDIPEATDLTIIQNAVEIILFRQVIDRRRSGRFLICHVKGPPSN